MVVGTSLDYLDSYRFLFSEEKKYNIAKGI